MPLHTCAMLKEKSWFLHKGQYWDSDFASVYVCISHFFWCVFCFSDRLSLTPWSCPLLLDYPTPPCSVTFTPCLEREGWCFLLWFWTQNLTKGTGQMNWTGQITWVMFIRAHNACRKQKWKFQIWQVQVAHPCFIRCSFIWCLMNMTKKDYWRIDQWMECLRRGHWEQRKKNGESSEKRDFCVLGMSICVFGGIEHFGFTWFLFVYCKTLIIR